MTSKISLGLRRISHLLKQLGNPQNSYDTIHVAGTNGKGSVSSMLAQALCDAGLKTGLYTSPHLIHKWDCININGVPISRTIFQEAHRTITQGLIHDPVLSNLENTLSNDSPTSFELMTAAAFEIFKRSQVDVAIVEVGLGGTRDATNVLDPLASVITTISLDHTNFLGSTIVEIAQAKGGIIKKDVPVIASSDQEYPQVFGVLGRIQRQVNPTKKIIWTPPNSTLDFRISNMNTARSALQVVRQVRLKSGRVLGEENLSDDLIEDSLQRARLRGRHESTNLSGLGGPRKVLLDGAHNMQAIASLNHLLQVKRTPRTFIFSLTEGKSPSMLSTLMNPDDTFIAVEFEHVDDMKWIKPLPSSQIYSALSMKNAGSDCGSDVLGAIRLSNEKGEKQREVIICGSLYLIGQIHRMLEASKYEQHHWSTSLSQGTSKQVTIDSYDPLAMEERVRLYWQDLPPLNPAAISKRPNHAAFLLPPPNVTGSLHLGHALTVSIQDSYARYYRGTGHEVTWVPGTDHAGIATQSVVTKQLVRSGLDSRSLSRDQLVAKIWDWQAQFGSRIVQQIRRLGATLDWDREYFTLDEARSAAVDAAFGRLWDAGLVRREQRMVNWSLKLSSVISDIEVDKRICETSTIIDGAQFGMMWRIRYAIVPLPGIEHTEEFLEVDTTRPETIFGDSAVAVHPDDARYSQLHGRAVKHPLIDDRILPIVADRAVKPDFGTGCVKITPAHDLNDYNLAARHSEISFISAFGSDGKLTVAGNHTHLLGMDRLLARAEIVSLLDKSGALVQERAHSTTVRLCSRTGGVIEPLVMPQWFISMTPLATEVLKQDSIRMSDKSRKEWHRWLTNIQDWCVSRQLVWGHRIPLYRFDLPNGEQKWVFGRNEDEASKKAGGRIVVQDEDVLDTWFSSALLPLSAFGWPTTKSISEYPLEMIESGPDILFFWLARMAMLCTFLNGTAPFKEIILHPLIRDEQGRKMSKSLGNVIDPLSIIEGESLEDLLSTLKSGNLNSAELTNASRSIASRYPKGIPAFGADALRLALINSTVQTEALKFDLRDVVAARYLCTKLWNAVNFHRISSGEACEIYSELRMPRCPVEGPLLDRWLWSEFTSMVQKYQTAFRERNLSAGTEAIRTFLVEKFCDTYIEFIKVDLRKLSSDHRHKRMEFYRDILGAYICLASAFIPHLAEASWHFLGYRCPVGQVDFSCVFDVQPELVDQEELGNGVSLLQDLLNYLRTLPDHKSASVTIQRNVNNSEALHTYQDHLAALSKVKSLSIVDKLPDNTGIPRFTLGDLVIQIEYAEGIISDSNGIPSETSSQRRLALKISNLETLVQDPMYKTKVPKAVQEKHHKQLESLKQQQLALKNS